MANTLHNLHKGNLSRNQRHVVTRPVGLYKTEKKDLTITALRTDPNNQLDVKRLWLPNKKLLQPQLLSSLFKDPSREVKVGRETGLGS